MAPASSTGPALMNGFEFLQAYVQRPERENPMVNISRLTTSLHPIDVAKVQGSSRFEVSDLLIPTVSCANRPSHRTCSYSGRLWKQ